MFGAIGRSITLLKVCLRVLATDKKLVLFPVLSTIGAAVLVLALMGTWIGTGAFDRIKDGSIGEVDLIIAAVFYILISFVVIFLNSALIHAAHERLTGGDPTIRSGLRGARDRVGTIFIWAVIAGTVGLALGIVSAIARRRAGIIGRIVAWILRGSWTILTAFVVPLIVIEGRSLIGAFGGSFSILRRTWGEQLAGHFGLRIASLLVFLVVGGIAALLFLALSPLGTWGIVTATVITLVLVIGLAAVFAALEGIYQAALYYYATTAQVPALFPKDVIESAFLQLRDPARHRR